MSIEERIPLYKELIEEFYYKRGQTTVYNSKTFFDPVRFEFKTIESCYCIDAPYRIPAGSHIQGFNMFFTNDRCSGEPSFYLRG